MLNLGLGGLIVKDYGESWDEANNRLYGEQSINAYTWWTNKDFPLENYLGPTNQRYRGAAYPMLVRIFASWMQTINNDWLTIDLWHFANFLFFQLGVLILYLSSVCKYLGSIRSNASFCYTTFTMGACVYQFQRYPFNGVLSG